MPEFKDGDEVKVISKDYSYTDFSGERTDPYNKRGIITRTTGEFSYVSIEEDSGEWLILNKDLIKVNDEEWKRKCRAADRIRYKVKI